MSVAQTLLSVRLSQTADPLEPAVFRVPPYNALSPMRQLPLIAAVAVVAGCALYSDVSISPLLISPGPIERGSDLPSMFRKADFVRAVEQASMVEAKGARNASNLVFLGQAEMAAGRFDD